MNGAVGAMWPEREFNVFVPTERRRTRSANVRVEKAREGACCGRYTSSSVSGRFAHLISHRSISRVDVVGSSNVDGEVPDLERIVDGDHVTLIVVKAEVAVVAEFVESGLRHEQRALIAEKRSVGRGCMWSMCSCLTSTASQSVTSIGDLNDDVEQCFERVRRLCIVKVRIHREVANSAGGSYVVGDSLIR
ncbi:hypothetical protein [Halomicrococcus sp. NG-SE-24]|uniref:hypothetical protein n=1 Tax=Halomicrococcus sp. NG-SE-24 TaxID=3436928 RepID=UPI003D9824F2